MKYASLYERLVANSAIPTAQNECGCWEWKGTLNTANYGTFSRRVPGKRTPKTCLAHREMEQLLRDQAAEREFDLAQPGNWWATSLVMGIKAEPLHPHDETTEHVCYLRRCTNPDHWVHVTRAENSALMRKRVLAEKT